MKPVGERLLQMQQSWKKLRRLGALPIDLSRVQLIRDLPRQALTDPLSLERLLPRLGLNDEGLEEYPETLHVSCGQGLRIWQLPNQFGPYLAALAQLDVRSYLEIGVRHGGSFVATVEVLDRVQRLRFALAVDIIPSPSLVDYQEMRPGAEFHCVNSRSAEFHRLLDDRSEIDMVFIDSFHEEEQLREEFLGVRNRCRIVGFHDIISSAYPGVGRVWADVRASGDYACREFIEQYTSGSSCMGIGLAIRRS